MRFEMKHTFKCDEETFWSKVFFDEEYNRRLFREALEFVVYEPLELKDEGGGSKFRRVKTQPKAALPGPLQKLLGDPVSVEEGRFDGATKRWSFRLIPHKLADKISIRGEQKMTPVAGGIERLSSFDINVDIFGVGGLLEGFVEKQLRENYDKGAVFTNRFLQEKGLASS